MAIGIDPQGITSVQKRHTGRVLSLMEAVADAETGLGVSELARRTDLAKTTAARILSELVALGMVDRVCEVYLPGPRLLAISHRVEPPGAAARRTLITPHLVRLRNETGLATAFSTLRYGRVRVESVLHVATSARTLAGVSRWPLAQHTSSGKVLLAFSPQGEALPVDHRGRVPYPEPTDPARLAAELAQIRDAGLAYSDSEYVPGIGAIAVPVLDRHGLAGVLAVSPSPPCWSAMSRSHCWVRGWPRCWASPGCRTRRVCRSRSWWRWWSPPWCRWCSVSWRPRTWRSPAPKRWPRR